MKRVRFTARKVEARTVKPFEHGFTDERPESKASMALFGERSFKLDDFNDGVKILVCRFNFPNHNLDKAPYRSESDVFEELDKMGRVQTRKLKIVEDRKRPS